MDGYGSLRMKSLLFTSLLYGAYDVSFVDWLVHFYVVAPLPTQYVA